MCPNIIVEAPQFILRHVRFVVVCGIGELGITPRLAAMKTHYVGRPSKCGKYTYWSLEHSYRDPVTGKPRKRRLAYYGRNKPFSLRDVDWHAFFHGLPEDRAMAAAERAMEKAGERPVVEEPSKLPQGLEQGPREPVEVEKPPSTIDYATPPAAPADDTHGSVSEAECPSEAPSGSDDASGS